MLPECLYVWFSYCPCYPMRLSKTFFFLCTSGSSFLGSLSKPCIKTVMVLCSSLCSCNHTLNSLLNCLRTQSSAGADVLCSFILWCILFYVIGGEGWDSMSVTGENRDCLVFSFKLTSSAMQQCSVCYFACIFPSISS